MRHGGSNYNGAAPAYRVQVHTVYMYNDDPLKYYFIGRWVVAASVATGRIRSQAPDSPDRSYWQE